MRVKSIWRKILVSINTSVYHPRSYLFLVTVMTEKQPRALYLLFFTELWERFGFYTLQTIIILYMTKSLVMADDKANLLYAAFSSLLFLTPTIGGYIADRFLGYQRAITLGGILFIAGYLVCALQGPHSFFIGLGLQICGNGFFKPNVSSIVGDLYEKNDPRRDGGFTIFYMGINIGSLIPPLIAGTLVTVYGWHSGFLLAAGGMMLGQMVFLYGKKTLHGIGSKPNDRHAAKHPGMLLYTLIAAGIAITVALCNLAFQYPEQTNYIVELAGVAIILVTAYFLFQEPLRERKKMFACLILIIISIGFWALYNQTFTSLMLFADRNMHKSLFGIPIDAEGTQFFNPFFIILLSPFLSKLWIKLDRFGLNPSVQTKFSLGIAFMCAGYLLLGFAAKFTGTDGITSAGWLAGSYLLQTMGELLLSPVGLSMITVLSPKHLVGMMMGVWFFSVAVGFSLGGSLANIAAVPDNMPATASLGIYAHAFMVYGYISLAIAVVSFALVPFLKTMINPVNPR
jgi:POT family proton-dependent oligopeptide transporter